MERKLCPDCGSDLGKSATKCRCGWKAVQAAITEENPNHIACAADASCRKPGRMFVEGLSPDQRLCVMHFYEALDRGAQWIEPPRKMPGAIAKPVSGAD